MTVEILEDYWVVTTADLMEVEEMLIVQIPPPKPPKPVKVELGFSRILVWELIGIALESFCTALLAGMVIKELVNYVSPEERRRVRTQICVYECLGILQSAAIDVSQGYYKNRALETDPEEKRKIRKFKSRA